MPNIFTEFLSVLKRRIIESTFYYRSGQVKLTSKRSIAILIIAVGAASILGYFYYSTMQQNNLVEISKQSSIVQGYLAQHPNATYGIWKSGNDWIVHWYDPTSMIPHIVNVLIDGNALQIINIQEAT